MTEINTNYYVYLGIGIAVLLFGLMALFYGINNLGITTTTGRAIISDKAYTPAGTTYRTTVVNNQSIVQPQSTSEVYAIVLDINGESALAVVAEKKYNQLNIGDEVTVSYRRTRLTRRLAIVDINQ